MSGILSSISGLPWSNQFTGTAVRKSTGTTTFTGFGVQEIVGALGTYTPSIDFCLQYYARISDPSGTNGLVLEYISPTRKIKNIVINGVSYAVDVLGAGWFGEGYVGVRGITAPFSDGVSATFSLHE